jgi:hypothetical protein
VGRLFVDGNGDRHDRGIFRLAADREFDRAEEIQIENVVP